MSVYDVYLELKEAFKKPIKDEPMLNELKALFNKEVSLVQTCKVSAMVINLVNEFNAQTLKDGNAKDVAIDCVIALLQGEKTQKPGA